MGMMRLARVLILAIFLAAGSAALGAERFPPPDFTEHKLPVTTVPPARAEWLNWLDVAFLAGALALASYLALGRRSRKGLFLLSIVSLAWLGFWRKGCVCPIGSIQNVTLALFDPSYTLPFTVVVFFTLPLLFAFFFGRTFCAAVCPLGAAQELVAIRPVRVARWLEHALGILPLVYLGIAVLFAGMGTAFLICQYDPFVALFRLSPSKMTIVGLCFLVIGLFVGRPYCRYLCPYGSLLGLASRVSKWHVRIPPEDCIKCRLCEDVCPYGAIREPTVPQPAAKRAQARRRLALMLALLPLLVISGILVGSRLATPLSYLHPKIRLAERVRLEETGQAVEPVDMTNAFRNTGRPVQEIYREALQLRERFGVAGGWLGGWIGLVLGVKLVHLSVRRRRSEYQPDTANCVSCGRCFWYCPSEQVRLGLIETLPVPTAPHQLHQPAASGTTPAVGSAAQDSSAIRA